MNQITKILKENVNDKEKARKEISKITKKPFELYEDNGSLFVEFDNTSDNVNFGNTQLLEENS